MSTAPPAPAPGQRGSGAAAKQALPAVASPARRLARSRLVTMLRRVRNSPAQPVMFVLCVGNARGSVFLAPKVTPSHRVQLRSFMGNDSGLRFHTGRCVFENGAYTFVGPTVTSSLRAKVEKGLNELTGMKWRVRLRSGVVADGADPET